MTSSSNHFKLGLFVLVVLTAALAATLALGARRMKKESVAYHTFFNESVQGLEVGSPVKFRGVRIGVVSAITIAADHRHIDVVEELNVDDIRRMGLAESGATARFHVPLDLRAQLGAQGITGLKFVSIDFFDPKTNPPPVLPFTPPAMYIPAAQSMMKNLEDTVTKAMDKLPELADAVMGLMARIDRIVAKVEEDDTTSRLSTTLAHADEVLIGLRGSIAKLDRSHLPEKATRAFEDVSKSLARMNLALDRIDGDDGLIVSLRRASDALAGLGRGSGATSRELEQTLREVRDAADSVRGLAEAIERDPDMLLKGRAKARSAPGGR